MKLRWRILIGVVVVLAALLTINTIVLESQTKEAEVTVDGGEILHLSSGDVQVTDSGEPAPSDAGQAQPIVLIHGYAGSLRWFDKLEPLLSAKHRVIRIDLLGFGGSEKPENGYAIADQARLVAEALNKLGVQGAMVVGHSMGGVVTASLAEQASELVDRAVLIDMAPDTSDRFDDDDSFLQDLSYEPVLGEAIWRTTPDFVIHDGLEKAFAPGFDFAEGFSDADVPVDDFRQMTYSSYEDAHKKVDEFGDQRPLNERFTSASVPLLVIFGSEDQLFDPKASLAGFDGVPGVEMTTIKGAGHSPQVEKPEQVAARLEKFAAPPVPLSALKQSDNHRKNKKAKNARGGSGGKDSSKGDSRKQNSSNRDPSKGNRHGEKNRQKKG